MPRRTEWRVPMLRAKLADFVPKREFTLVVQRAF
jgi:hypothetical protein